MRRTHRLEQLLQILRAHRLTTAEGLASELGVSKRTVYRDVRELVRSGIGVRGEPGVGYALSRGVAPQPLGFTSEEIHALLAAVRGAEGVGAELEEGLRTAIAKLEAALPG